MPETGKEADINPAEVTIREPERTLERSPNVPSTKR
jgi:hypothetical protein